MWLLPNTCKKNFTHTQFRIVKNLLTNRLLVISLMRIWLMWLFFQTQKEHEPRTWCTLYLLTNYNTHLKSKSLCFHWCACSLHRINVFRNNTLHIRWFVCLMKYGNYWLIFRFFDSKCDLFFPKWWIPDMITYVINILCLSKL